MIVDHNRNNLNMSLSQIKVRFAQQQLELAENEANQINNEMKPANDGTFLGSSFGYNRQLTVTGLLPPESGLYYKTDHNDKNQDFPKQIPVNPNERVEFPFQIQAQKIDTIATFRSQEPSQRNLEGFYQNQTPLDENQLHFKASEEFNEDNLIQEYAQCEEEQINAYQSEKKVEGQAGKNDLVKKQDSKVSLYLKQMMENTKSLEVTDRYAEQFLSNRSRTGNTQQTIYNLLEKEDEQRVRGPPKPQTLNMESNLSCREIAHIKQKQRTLSQERLKEGKQQQILSEIAHFYRQLAPTKQNNVQQINQVEQIEEPKKRNDSNIQLLGQQSSNSISTKLTRFALQKNEHQKSKNPSLEKIKNIQPEQSNQQKKNKEKVIYKLKEQILQDLLKKEKFIDECQMDEPQFIEKLKQTKAIIRFPTDLTHEIQIAKFIALKNREANLNELKGFINKIRSLSYDLEQIDQKKKIRKISLTQAQEQKEEEMIALLSDIRQKISLKVFFIYTSKVCIGYKNCIMRELECYSNVRQRIFKKVIFAGLKNYFRIKAMKNRLKSLTQKELDFKRLKKSFDAIYQSSRKTAVYQSVSSVIRETKKLKLKQIAFNSMNLFYKQKKFENKKLILSYQIYQSHLLVRAFLILKAFQNRKKGVGQVQTLTTKDISLQFTLDLADCLKSQRQKGFILNKSVEKVEHFQDQQEEEQSSYFIDGTYDSEQFEKHFYCEEEYLKSARSLIQVQRELTLKKIGLIGDNQQFDFNCNTNGQNRRDFLRNLLRKYKMAIKKEMKYSNPCDQISKLPCGRIIDLIKGASKEYAHPNAMHSHRKIITVIENTERNQELAYKFQHWRSLFLKKQLEKEIIDYRKEQISSKLWKNWMSMTQKTQKKALLISEKNKIRTVYKIWREWLDLAKQNLQLNQERIEFFQKQQMFKRLKNFTDYQKVEKAAQEYYYQTKLKQIINSWSEITNKNNPVRKLQKKGILRRSLSTWRGSLQKKRFLQKFWIKILYTPEELIYKKFQTRDLFLQAILQNWRSQVIENENSADQKIQNLAAEQHYRSSLVTRTFFAYLRIVRKAKALNIIFKTNSAVQKILAKSIIYNWRQAISFEEQRIVIHRKKINLSTIKRIFNKMKEQQNTKKQGKLNFLINYFFFWKGQTILSRIKQPSEIYEKNLKKKCLAGLMLRQANSIRQCINIQKGNTFYNSLLKNQLIRDFKLWIKYVEKKKSERSLNDKLDRFASKTLKKKVMSKLKLNRILMRLKTIQLAKAIEFHEIQQRKKYNLKRLLNEKKAQGDLLYILEFIHRWKEFTLKQKCIKYVSERFKKYQSRNIKNRTFKKWYEQFLFRQREEFTDVKVLKNQQEFDLPKQQNPKLFSEKEATLKYVDQQAILRSGREIHQQNPKQEEDRIMNMNDRTKSLLKKDEGRGKRKNSLEIAETIEKGNLIRSDSFQRGRFQSEEAEVPKSARSTSRSPSGLSQRKSVRFEILSEKATNPMTELDNKYNENEAFYQKLLASKKKSN